MMLQENVILKKALETLRSRLPRGWAIEAAERVSRHVDAH
jgi:hypothetical protein